MNTIPPRVRMHIVAHNLEDAHTSIVFGLASAQSAYDMAAVVHTKNVQVEASTSLLLRDANRVATPPRRIPSGVAMLFVRRARQSHRLARRAVIRSLAARDFAERKLNNMKDELDASFARIEEVLGDTIYAKILDDDFQYPDLSEW